MRNRGAILKWGAVCLVGLALLAAALCMESAQPVPSTVPPTTVPSTVPPTTVPETTAATQPVTVPATVPPATEPVETEPPEQVRARQILEEMTPEEKICQLFIVTHDQLAGISGVTRSDPAVEAALAQYPVGGVIYFSPNLRSREQTVEMIAHIQSCSRLGLFISVDEEGGSVTRLGRNRAMGVTDFPSMGIIGRDGDTAAAYEVGHTLGTELAELGFNLDFAPVADVDSNPDNPVIGSRAFHSDPQTAADLVAACVEGFNDSGMLCVLKHFPGHGDTAGDSHYGAVSLDKTLQELEECELMPFRAGIGAGAPCVMVGHISLPGVTRQELPATLSYGVVTCMLRERLGFEGLIITDSMSMQAITDSYPSGEAAVMALRAGVDVILMPQNLSDAIGGIRKAVESGELSQTRIDESVLRILETKLRSGIIPME